jgi:hypothetical protein
MRLPDVFREDLITSLSSMKSFIAPLLAGGTAATMDTFWHVLDILGTCFWFVALGLFKTFVSLHNRVNKLESERIKNEADHKQRHLSFEESLVRIRSDRDTDARNLEEYHRQQISDDRRMAAIESSLHQVGQLARALITLGAKTELRFEALVRAEEAAKFTASRLGTLEGLMKEVRDSQVSARYQRRG